MLQHARRLGLAHGKTLMLDSIDELPLAFDLAIHTCRFRKRYDLLLQARLSGVSPR